jgi:hypothetical protein
MTRDEIYDHLAQVYLGKKNNQTKPKPEKKQFSAWLVVNLIITVVIFATSFYGFTAFLTRRSDTLQNRVIFGLNKGPISLRYNLEYPYPQIKMFSIAVPGTDAKKYDHLEFAIRGAEGSPGMIRVEIRNSLNETSSVFIDNINGDWDTKSVSFEKFEGISDWTSVSEVLFVLESWNTRSQKGLLLIDDVCFSSAVTS